MCTSSPAPINIVSAIVVFHIKTRRLAPIALNASRSGVASLGQWFKLAAAIQRITSFERHNWRDASLVFIAVHVPRLLTAGSRGLRYESNAPGRARFQASDIAGLHRPLSSGLCAFRPTGTEQVTKRPSRDDHATQGHNYAQRTDIRLDELKGGGSVATALAVRFVALETLALQIVPCE